jgi:SOS response regulatory protein OraA/RecX
MTRLSENDHVPGIIRRCIEYLDEYGWLHHHCAARNFTTRDKLIFPAIPVQALMKLVYIGKQ